MKAKNALLIFVIILQLDGFTGCGANDDSSEAIAAKRLRNPNLKLFSRKSRKR